MLEAARPDTDDRQERIHWISAKFNDKRTWSDFKKISGYDKEMLLSLCTFRLFINILIFHKFRYIMSDFLGHKMGLTSCVSLFYGKLLPRKFRKTARKNSEILFIPLNKHNSHLKWLSVCGVELPLRERGGWGVLLHGAKYTLPG